MIKIKTAYGIRTLSTISHIDRKELVSEINSLLSIRNPNSEKFYNTLKSLVEKEKKNI